MCIKESDGSVASSEQYKMERFWESSVKRYIDLAGHSVRMKVVPTPFLVEDSSKGLAGAPCATGPMSECPWCAHTFAPVVHEDSDVLNKKTKVIPTGNDLEDTAGGGNSADPNKPPNKREAC